LNSSIEITVRISRVRSGANDIPLPRYATSGASGMDICAAVESDLTLAAGETKLVPTGFRIAIPEGYEAQVRPRSGLALKQGIGILNAPGTIDSDYRGELGIIITNFGKGEFVVHRGDRIAQLVIAPVVKAVWEEVPEVDDTARGEGGFGHTGTK
jgi:dUTP pyrophosphatase